LAISKGIQPARALLLIANCYLPIASSIIIAMIFKLALLMFAVALVVGLFSRKSERMMMGRIALIGFILLLLAGFIKLIRL